MKNVLTIFGRELRAYFNSAIAYIFIIVFLLITVGLFMTQFFIVSNADMRWLFSLLPVVLAIVLPAVTMRLWSEDRSRNTLELLLTFPVKTSELVAGKYLASLVFYCIALLATVPVPVMIGILGNPDPGSILGQYCGALFMGGFYLAIGLFVSGFCKDQIVAFIISMMACFTFFLVGAEFTVASIEGWVPGLGELLRSTFGMIGHYASFERGVIDTRDILYFIIGAAIFLVLNGLWLESRLRPKAATFFAVTSLVGLAIFAVGNYLISDTPIGRFDLTEGRIYTVSPETGSILRGLEAPVTVKVFLSPPDKMPGGMKTLERDLRDKLDEFRIASSGKFVYKVFHKEAAEAVEAEEEELERSIEDKGIQPFQVQSIEADEVGVKLIYAALTIAYKDKPEEIVPRILPESLPGLEYIIVSKIYKMAMDETPLVAVMAPYTEQMIDPQMRQLLQYLGQDEMRKYRQDAYELIPSLLEYEGYAHRRIRLTEQEPIPEGTDTLVILEPTKLNDRQRFEINRFLVGGGSVFLAVQKYEYLYEIAGTEGVSVEAIDKKPGINELIGAWGVTVSDNVLMDMQNDVINVSSGSVMGLFPVSSPIKLPMQITVINEEMNQNVPITARLGSLMYLWGSALTIDRARMQEIGLTGDVLFTSSRDAWEVRFHAGSLTEADVKPPVPGERQKFPLAVFIEGQFTDAFSGSEVPPWPRKKQEEAAQPEEPETASAIEKRPGKLILVGCAKMFNKELFQDGGHIGLFLNSIDTLTLSEELVTIRGKQPVDRAIRKVSSSQKAMWRMVTTFLVPALLVCLGWFRIMMRKRAKWVYARKGKGL